MILFACGQGAAVRAVGLQLEPTVEDAVGWETRFAEGTRADLHTATWQVTVGRVLFDLLGHRGRGCKPRPSTL
jgi:hypothetical protein